MFGNKLSFTNGVIFAVLLGLITALIITIIIGRIFLYLYGKNKPIKLSGQEILNSLIEKNKFTQAKVCGKPYSTCLFTSYRNQKEEMIVNKKILTGKNLFAARQVFFIFNYVDEIKSRIKVNKYQLIVLLIIFFGLVIDLIGISIILAIGPITNGNSDGSLLTRGWQITIEGLAILGWFLIIAILLLWMNYANNTMNTITEIAKNILDKQEISQLKKYLKIWSYLPFGNRIFILV